MSRLYCDANTVVALFIDEKESPVVDALLRGSDVELVVSDLAVLEVTSTFGRLVRERRLLPQKARELLSDLDGWAEGVEILPVTPEAFASARVLLERFELGLRGPDALHLALAQAAEAPIASFDRRLLKAAEAFAIASVPLARQA